MHRGMRTANPSDLNEGLSTELQEVHRIVEEGRRVHLLKICEQSNKVNEADSNVWGTPRDERVKVLVNVIVVSEFEV